MPDALDFGVQDIVALRPVRTPIRITLLSLAGVVAGVNPSDNGSCYTVRDIRNVTTAQASYRASPLSDRRRATA